MALEGVCSVLRKGSQKGLPKGIKKAETRLIGEYAFLRQAA